MSESLTHPSCSSQPTLPSLLSRIVLPPMGHEERQEVSLFSCLLHQLSLTECDFSFLQLAKLASIYKLRCRYGKSVQVAPSTLIKARLVDSSNGLEFNIENSGI